MKTRGLIFILILPLVFACTRHSRVQVTKSAVLKINQDSITATEFAQKLAKKLKTFDALAAKDTTNIKRAREDVIREFIISSLLQQYAQTNSISVTDQELSEEFDKIRKDYPDDLTFKASLAGEGENIDDWKEALRKTLLQRKVFGAIAPVADLHNPPPSLVLAARQYYESHADEFQRPAQIHIQQIIVPREDDAERLLKKIKAGSSFGELAKKYSVSPDGHQGGDIGYVPRGVLDVFDAGFKMNVGQLSPITKSSYGFHIIKVLDKRPAGRVNFDQAKAKIMRQIQTAQQQKIFDSWLDQQIKNAKVERSDDLLEHLKVRTESEEE